jgi:hypothetical protein
MTRWISGQIQMGGNIVMNASDEWKVSAMAKMMMIDDIL